MLNIAILLRNFFELDIRQGVRLVQNGFRRREFWRGNVVFIKSICIIQCIINMKGVWAMGDRMHAQCLRNERHLAALYLVAMNLTYPQQIWPRVPQKEGECFDAECIVRQLGEYVGVLLVNLYGFCEFNHFVDVKDRERGGHIEDVFYTWADDLVEYFNFMLE